MGKWSDTNLFILQFRSDLPTDKLFIKFFINNPYSHLFTMSALLSILSALLQNHEADNIKILFVKGFNIQIADHVLLNKWVIYRVNKYIAINIKDYDLSKYIQIDFEMF